MNNLTVTITVPPVKTEVFLHCAGCEKTTPTPRPPDWLEFSVRAHGNDQKIILCPDCSGTSGDFIRGNKKPSDSCYASQTEFATYRCSFCQAETRRCVYPPGRAISIGQNPWRGYAFITVQGSGYGREGANKCLLCCPRCSKEKLKPTPTEG